MKLSASLIICLLLAAASAGAPDSLPGRRATAQASGWQAPQKMVERPPRAATDPLDAQRRAAAVSLLTSLADKARTFRDGTLRARAQARAADALWESDPELARTLFRRAWADADAADREIERKREEDRKAQLASGGVAMQSVPPALRAEILRLAGRRDRALGEEFIALLARLDEKGPAQAGAGDLPYVFTPFIYFTSYKTSGTGMSSGKDTPAPDVAPALRTSFMRAAAQILLRPTTPQEYDNTSAGRAGSYIIIRRLLLLFDRHAPDLTPALNARAASLLPDVPERLRAAEAEGGFSLSKSERAAPRDAVQAALERAERTTGTAERDEIYAAAAVNATW